MESGIALALHNTEQVPFDQGLPTPAKPDHDWVNRPQSTSLVLYEPIGNLACPARFERATSALEEIVAAQRSNNFNDLNA